MAIMDEMAIARIFSSVPFMCANKERNRVHPDKLLGSKVVSLKGTTGRVSAVFSENRREDRYDSITIDWDNGVVSHRVFLCWFDRASVPANPGLKFFVNEHVLSQRVCES